MRTNLRKSIICVVLVMILGLCNLSGALADDTLGSGGWHYFGSFSFTDDSLSSAYTVEGRYVTIRIDYHKPDWDAGIGDIYLNFEIRDAYTGAVIPYRYTLGPTGSTTVGDTFYYIDLGYSGRKVKFWFDASSAGPSNGNYRSAVVDVFRVYVY